MSLFSNSESVRQGDPLSPILFNIVVDMLVVLIARAKEDEQLTGVVPHLVDNGLYILQYPDGTVIFMENDLDQAKNMKLLLCAFEQLSGLTIIFIRVSYFVMGQQKN